MSNALPFKWSEMQQYNIQHNFMETDINSPDVSQARKQVKDRRCWTRSEGHHGEKIKNGSFASDLRFVHISISLVTP